MPTKGVLHIRPMLEEDIPAKARVHSQTWQETYEDTLPASLNQQITPAFTEQCTRKLTDCDTLLLFSDDELVGYATFQLAARDHFKRLHTSELCNLYILKSHQHVGGGRLLIQAVIDATEPNDVALTVFASNARAIQFYEHMGFRQTGVHYGEGKELELEMLFSRQQEQTSAR